VWQGKQWSDPAVDATRERNKARVAKEIKKSNDKLKERNN